MQPVLFLSHGGGPLPLLNDPDHAGLNSVFSDIAASLTKPKAIIMISAHWEEPVFTVSSTRSPGMLYDYGGFSSEAYLLQYPAAGEPELASSVAESLEGFGITVSKNANRDFDHGVFVPLLLLFPEADVPVVTVSLNKNFDAAEHIEVGHALSKFREQDCLIIGSGMQFHNLPLMFNSNHPTAKKSAAEFTNWLDNSLSNSQLTDEQRASKLANWEAAPSSRLAHPREEHLLPLHVCLGAAGSDHCEQYSYDFLGLPGRCYRWGEF